MTPYHAHAGELGVKGRGIREERERKRGWSEEQKWLRKIVLGCWTTLMADAARAANSMATIPGQEVVSGERRRTLSSLQ